MDKLKNVLYICLGWNKDKKKLFEGNVGMSLKISQDIALFSFKYKIHGQLSQQVTLKIDMILQ